MHKLKLIFVFFLLSTALNGQVTNIELGDTTYLQRLILDEDTTGLWEFREDLSAGKYWVIEKSECGLDTLMYAQFIAEGIKHGTWIEWHSRPCFGPAEENLSEAVEWQFVNEKKFKIGETTFDSGFLVKSLSYDLVTGQPWMEHHYPPQTIKNNQWKVAKMYSRNGNLRWVMIYDDQGEYYNEEVYYDNGILREKGRRTDKEDDPIGKWLFWDEQGELIAKLRFKNGEPIVLRRFQDKELPFWAIPK